MWIKQKTLSLLLAFVTSSIAVPVTYDHNYAPDHEYEPKDYSFSYGVKDLHTGDVKHQWEKKEGDQVRGHYSVLEPDGSVRIVDYTADSKTGFNAVVKHKGTSYHPSPSKPTSHREFELKPGKTAQNFDSHDYSLLKDIDDSKSSVTHVDSYGNYVPVKHGYPQEQLEQDHQEVQVGTYTPEYKYEYAPEAEAGDQYSYEATSHTYEEADYAADSSKYETRYAKHQPNTVKLPVDVSVLKPHLKQDIVPVDVSVLKPIEINLNDVREGEKYSYDHGNSTAQLSQETNLKDSYASDTKASNRPYHRVTEDDYQKFLKEYYKTENINESQQLSEEEYTKFLKNYYNKEQLSKPDVQAVQIIPTSVHRNKANTFRTNKKPATTPGLRNYSTGNKYARPTRRPKLQYQAYYGGQKGPILFPSINRDGNGLKPNGSLYKNPGNLYVRYAKRINYYSST